MNDLLKLLAVTLLLGTVSAVPNSGSDASAEAKVVDEKKEEPKKPAEEKKNEKEEESKKVDEVKNDKKQEEPKKPEGEHGAKEHVHNAAHPHANHKKENDLTKILNQSQAPYTGPVGEISAPECCADKTDGNAVAAK